MLEPTAETALHKLLPFLGPVASTAGWLRGTILAGGPALVCLGLVLASAGTPESNAVSAYRPGGLDLHQASRVLASRPGSIEGCAPLSGPNNRDAAEARPGSIERVLAVLAKSPTARPVMARARDRGVHVCLDEKTELLAYYFSSMGVIGVSTELSEGGRVAFLAHELSHVPQHPRYSDNRYYPPEDLFLLRRIREATAEAVATRIAWELRAAGYPEPWIEKADSPYSDVARAFQYAAESDGSSQGLQAATRAAFDRWFAAGWRRNVYDRMTLDHLRRISSDGLGLVPPRQKLHERFLIGIAALGGGNFLVETHGPALNDPYYTGRISNRNKAGLRRVLHDAELAAVPIGEAPTSGAAL